MALGRTPGCYPLILPKMGPSSSCRGKGGSGSRAKVIYSHMGRVSPSTSLTSGSNGVGGRPAVFPLLT